MGKTAVRRYPAGVLLFVALCLLAAAAGVSPAHSQTTSLRRYKLSGDAPPFLDVLSFNEAYHVPKVQVSPDGRHVVFWADYETDGAHDLYSVPLAGGEQPQRISEPHTADLTGDFRITPDSSRVVYWLKDLVSGATQLNSVPIGGGAVAKLSQQYLAPGPGRMFTVTADSQHVIYEADGSPVALFSVPTAGGAEVRLTPLTKATDVALHQVTADGQNVIFRMQTDNAPIRSVPSGGGEIVTLADESDVGESLGHFVLSPDGSMVYYIVYRKLLFPPRESLYRVPAGGGEAELVDIDLAQFENNALHLAISPDNQYVVVQANYYEKNEEIYSLPTAGGDHIPLHGSMLKTIYTARFDPAGTHVVYGAVALNESENDLFSVPVDGGQVVQLDAGKGNYAGYKISPDGANVTFIINESLQENLFSVPLGGGEAQMLNDHFPLSSQGVYAYEITPPGDRVVYHADQDELSVYELYTTPIGGGEPARINGPLAPGGFVAFGGWAVSPDGRTVVYVADQDTPGKKELYATYLGSDVFLPHVVRGQ